MLVVALPVSAGCRQQHLARCRSFSGANLPEKSAAQCRCELKGRAVSSPAGRPDRALVPYCSLRTPSLLPTGRQLTMRGQNAKHHQQQRQMLPLHGCC